MLFFLDWISTFQGEIRAEKREGLERAHETCRRILLEVGERQATQALVNLWVELTKIEVVLRAPQTESKNHAPTDIASDSIGLPR